MAHYKGKIKSSSEVKTTSQGKIGRHRRSLSSLGQPVDGMFGAEILAKKDVPLNTPQWEGARSLTFLWPGESRAHGGEKALSIPMEPMKHLPLGLWEGRQRTGKIFS